MRVLLDTCIVIDALQNREPFSADAQAIFLAVANRAIEGYITAKSITDIYYLTHRLTHSDKATRDILNKLFSLFGVLDTTANDCREAVFSDVSDYEDAVRRLTAHGIRVVTHLILGLPGETREMMLDSVRRACEQPIFGLKLHMLNVVRGSGLALAMPDYDPFDSMEDYIDLLISALEIVPPEITLHRISGDAPRATLIAPPWSYKKRTILNNIHKKMRQADTWQGRLV